MTDQQDQSKMPSVPGNASVDPEVSVFAVDEEAMQPDGTRLAVRRLK